MSDNETFVVDTPQVNRPKSFYDWFVEGVDDRDKDTARKVYFDVFASTPDSVLTQTSLYIALLHRRLALELNRIKESVKDGKVVVRLDDDQVQKLASFVVPSIPQAKELFEATNNIKSALSCLEREKKKEGSAITGNVIFAFVIGIVLGGLGTALFMIWP